MNRRLRYASRSLHRRLVPYTAAKETWTLPLRRLSSQSHDLAIIERGIGFGDGHASNQLKHRQRQTDLITNRNHNGREADQTATRARSEEHTSELQPLMHTAYAVFLVKKKIHQ